MVVPDTCSFSFRWRYPGALGRLALSHRQGSASGKRSTQSRRVPTKLPPHQTRGGMSFNCQGTARAGRGLLHLVGTDSEDPRIEANLCERARSRPAFFLLDRPLRSRWRLCRLRMRHTPCGCGPFSFRQDEKKMGGGLPDYQHSLCPSHRTAPRQRAKKERGTCLSLFIRSLRRFKAIQTDSGSV